MYRFDDSGPFGRRYDINPVAGDDRGTSLATPSLETAPNLTLPVASLDLDEAL